MDKLFANQQYNKNNFFLIAGPCITESEDVVMEIGEKVSAVCKRLEIPYIFKASYRKANRTSASSFTGIGDEVALKLIKKVGKKFNVPTTTDIHAHEEAAMAAEYVDILQIPAFLCSSHLNLHKARYLPTKDFVLLNRWQSRLHYRIFF